MGSLNRVSTGKFSRWVPLLALLVMLLAPYLYAVASGQSDPSVQGLAVLHSRAESVYCSEGITPTGIWLMVETAVVAVIALLSTRWKPKFNYLNALVGNSSSFFIVLLLVTIPFLFAWQTQSSVCFRGKAFFWESIFIEVFILSILAISYNLLFGFTGILSFGHSAFFGMGAYLFGLILLHTQLSWWMAVLLALLVGLLIAVIMGFVGLRVRGLYFALFTMALSGVLYMLAANRILDAVTGAEDGFTFSPPEFLNMTQNRIFIYYLTLAILILSYWLIRRLMGSSTGQVLQGLRGNEERTRIIGFNTFNFKLIALIVAGFLATTAGILRAIAFKGASPDLLGVGFTFEPLVATIIGGTGTFAGPVVGVFISRFAEQFLRDSIITIGAVEINIGEKWPLMLGFLFILIVIAFPKGIVGTFQDLWRKISRKP